MNKECRQGAVAVECSFCMDVFTDFEITERNLLLGLIVDIAGAGAHLNRVCPATILRCDGGTTDLRDLPSNMRHVYMNNFGIQAAITVQCSGCAETRLLLLYLQRAEIITKQVGIVLGGWRSAADFAVQGC